MFETTRRDLEGGSDPDGDQNPSAPNQPSQPSRGESSFGDSSGPFFSIYSKAAEEEDNKMVERWQKDADGILIFTGLFSAAVAALLSVTVQDLRPNSQDTSAFYLGNIYEVLADPNVTRSPTPSPIAKPPPFSPPRYAVCVNSLWFLSLVMGLSCALLATSLHQWARRYTRLTQPARCSPESRARVHAFFANGADRMHIPWAVEGLPTILHLSLFLFFAGLVIFLFHIDHEVFISVVWWIGLFSMAYGLITLLPIIRQDSPYYAPLSIPTWFLYAGIQYVTFKALASITNGQTWMLYRDSRDRYRGWMLGGVEKAAEEMASKRPSEVDARILGWTVNSLGDDDSLEKFFEAIPGLVNSKLVYLEGDCPETLLKTFWGVLEGFMARTLSSNSVTESVKSHRITISRDIMNVIPCFNSYLHDSLRSPFDQLPPSIEGLRAMARWFDHVSSEVSYTARARAAKNLARMQKRDSHWITFASYVYGLSKRDIQHYVALGGDNVFLAALISVSRRIISEEMTPGRILVAPLTNFNIRDTLPGLQHDFCTLWNNCIQEIKKPGTHPISYDIFRLTRDLYEALHQGAGASFPFCDIASHRPDSTAHISTQPGDSPNVFPHHSTSSSGTILRQVKKASIIAEPPTPTTRSEIGDSSQAPAATEPACTSPHPADALLPGAVAAALQDISLAATLTHPLEGTTPRDIVAACAESDVCELLITASMPTPAPASPAPNASCDAGGPSASNPLLPASSVFGFSVPPSPPPSHVLPRTTADFFSIFRSVPPSRSVLPGLRARGLVNTGSMCFANAVLQLLVHSPPFWNLFTELGDLRGQRGAGGPETGGCETPLVYATVKFLQEFMFKEGPPPTQEAACSRREPTEDEEEKKELNAVDSFEPTYLYDAMKEERRLKKLLNGEHQDVEEFLGFYLDGLDEELVELRDYISTHQPASDPIVEVQSGSDRTAEVGKRGYTASSFESPVLRIFGGRYHSTVRALNRSDTLTIEAWRSLQLDIQPDSVHTIQDALAHFSQCRPVRVGQSSSINATQQVLLEGLPPVIVLHLKRFLYDAAANGINKIKKPIQFAPELEISPEIMAPISKPVEQVPYKLYGVLYHHGESTGSGHYTVDVLHPNGDSSRNSGETWLHIDDEAVRPVRHEDVFGAHGVDDDMCAYMLFYCHAPYTGVRKWIHPV